MIYQNPQDTASLSVARPWPIPQELDRRTGRSGNRTAGNIIPNLKKSGEPLILISHSMRQVFDLVDRIVVYRCRRVVANFNKNEISGDEVDAYITGVKTAKEYADAA